MILWLFSFPNDTVIDLLTHCTIILLFLMKLGFFVVGHYFSWCVGLSFYYRPWSTKSNCVLVTLCLLNIFAGWCNNYISNKRIGQTNWWSLAKVYWRSLTFKVSMYGYKYGKERFKAAAIIMQLMIIMLIALLRCNELSFSLIHLLGNSCWLEEGILWKTSKSSNQKGKYRCIFMI